MPLFRGKSCSLPQTSSGIQQRMRDDLSGLQIAHIPFAQGVVPLSPAEFPPAPPPGGDTGPGLGILFPLIPLIALLLGPILGGPPAAPPEAAPPTPPAAVAPQPAAPIPTPGPTEVPAPTAPPSAAPVVPPAAPPAAPVPTPRATPAAPPAAVPAPPPAVAPGAPPVALPAVPPAGPAPLAAQPQAPPVALPFGGSNLWMWPAAGLVLLGAGVIMRRMLRPDRRPRRSSL